MPVAEYSAIVAKFSRENLQRINIENKIETARQNLIFSEKQLVEKKMEFDELQSKLANFSDSNIYAVNSFVINEKNKLEAEFQIIFGIVGFVLSCIYIVVSEPLKKIFNNIKQNWVFWKKLKSAF